MKRAFVLTAIGIMLLSPIATYASLDEADIIDKTDDGSILKTDDGATWAIDSVDQVDTALWMVTDTVIEDDESSACASYQLINKDENNETACARKIQ